MMVPCAVPVHAEVAGIESGCPGRPAVRFAMPKSSSFVPEAVSMMLAGFRSRWTMPCAMCHLERVRDFDAEAQVPVRAATSPGRVVPPTSRP